MGRKWNKDCCLVSGMNKRKKRLRAFSFTNQKTNKLTGGGPLLVVYQHTDVGVPVRWHQVHGRSVPRHGRHDHTVLQLHATDGEGCGELDCIGFRHITCSTLREVGRPKLESVENVVSMGAAGGAATAQSCTGRGGAVVGRRSKDGTFPPQFLRARVAEGDKKN